MTIKKILWAMGLVSLATLAMAQPYPNKPVKLVVPFAPGGTTDIVANNRGIVDPLAGVLSKKLQNALLSVHAHFQFTFA